VTGLVGLPNLNDYLFTLLKENETPTSNGRVFLSAVFQAVLMSRWNLLWIFLDVALGIDFHRHSKHRILRRESTGTDLMVPKFAAEILVPHTNMVEVWIVGV